MGWYEAPRNPRVTVEYGQEASTGDLLFAVRVKGGGAKPYPPARYARELCEVWTDAMQRMENDPLCSVKLLEPESR